jgi:hypothetical protein
MFTAWTAQRMGIKRGGRRDVATASNQNRGGNHKGWVNGPLAHRNERELLEV